MDVKAAGWKKTQSLTVKARGEGSKNTPFIVVLNKPGSKGPVWDLARDKDTKAPRITREQWISMYDAIVSKEVFCNVFNESEEKAPF